MPKHDALIKTKMINTNPDTQYLAEHAKVHDGRLAIHDILTVEGKAIDDFMRQSEYHLDAMFWLVKQAIEDGRQVFLVGCGPSGHVVCMIERFIQESGYKGADKIKAVIAGGDVAMVTEVPGIIGDAQAARDQLKLHGFQPGDAVIAFGITPNPFICEAVQYAVEDASGNAMLMTFANEAVTDMRMQSYKWLYDGADDDQIHLFTVDGIAPPAVAGCYFMHPKTLQLLACLPILNVFDKAYGDYQGEGKSIRCALVKPDVAQALASGMLSMHFSRMLNRPIAIHIQTSGCWQASLLAPFFTMAETLPAYGLQWEVHDDQQPEFKVQIGDCKTAESAWQMLMGHRMPVDLQHSAYALTTTAARKPFDFSTMGLAQWKAAIHDNYDTIAIGISDAKLSFDLGHETRVITMTGLSAFAQLVFTEAALNAQFATLMARQGFMVGNAIKAKSGPKKNFPTRTMPTKRQNAATASSTADSFSAGVGGACMLAGAAGLLWRRPQAARHAAKQMMQVVKRYSPF